MAEAFGIVAGSLAVLEIIIKVIKQCKTLMETAHDAPRDLRHVLIEMSSLKAVLESFEFLSRAEFSDNAQNLVDANRIVEACQSTVGELSKELDGLSLANTSQVNVTLGKRQRIKGSLQWCLKESKTRKLLDEAMQHKTTLTLALLGEITSDVKEIKSTVERVRDQLTDTDQRKMCNWIEETNPTPIHNRSCKNHEKHTCQWIHRVDQWKDWLHLQRRLIWIHGIPGAGKTILASYLIQQTITYCESLQNSRIVCLYYYCSFLHGQEERRDEALPFLRWIVTQLCRRSNHIPVNLIPLYRQNSIPSLQELKEAFQELLVHFDVLFIVVDAVDESNPRDILIELIQDIVTQPNYGKIQLLVTSRRYADIEDVLRPLSEPTLPMSNSIVDADIRSYIDTILQRNKYLARWSGKLQKEVAEALAQGSQGMFRWVVCQIDRLQRKSPQQAREVIKCLPQTLEETYETILLEISRDDWSTARTALQWISGHSDLQFSYGIPANCLSAAVLSAGHTSMLNVCEGSYEHEFLKVILGCLIELSLIDSDEDPDWPFGGSYPVDGDPDGTCFHTVSLAHYTIQEFLFSDRIKTSRVSYFTMSRNACAHKMLEVVLHPKTEGNYSLSPHAYNAFESYCKSIARRCLDLWEAFLLQNVAFWHEYHEFFNEHRYSWNKLCHTDKNDPILVLGLVYKATDDPTTMKIQYLIAILDSGCINMAEKLLEELSLEDILCVSAPVSQRWIYGSEFATNEPGVTTILDVFGAQCGCSSLRYQDLIDILKSRMELPKLLLFYLGAHYHEFACDKLCVIADLLDAGVNANPHGYLLTPLQVAVQNWDYAGVRILLEYGADPNAVGQPGGYIPAHIDTTWAQSSPLHIMRNAEYQFMAMEFCLGFKAVRGKDLFMIEALLLEHGAKDFV